MADLNLDGMSIAPGIVETIVGIAVSEVDGVANVGASSVSGIRGLLSGKNASSGVEVSQNDDEEIAVTVRIDVNYGVSLVQIASEVRKAVAEAFASQLGAKVNSVDVYIDGIVYDK